jgi:hypothetical protein
MTASLRASEKDRPLSERTLPMIIDRKHSLPSRRRWSSTAS